MGMERRSNVVRGHVEFPVDDPSYENTMEGGMFVRLVVLDDEDDTDLVCCGGANYVDDDETLIGDNYGRSPENVRTEIFHSPYPEGVSDECLAVLTIGSTGWSGYDHAVNAYWRATVDDLTPEGKRLCCALEEAFPRKRLRLLTWLDT